MIAIDRFVVAQIGHARRVLGSLLQTDLLLIAQPFDQPLCKGRVADGVGQDHQQAREISLRQERLKLVKCLSLAKVRFAPTASMASLKASKS